MSEDMAFAEGCYRLEGGSWQVVTAVKAKASALLVSATAFADSGVTGMKIILPATRRSPQWPYWKLCRTSWASLSGATCKALTG